MNVWGCRRRWASVAKARVGLFARLIMRTIRQQQRGAPIWASANGNKQAEARDLVSFGRELGMDENMARKIIVNISRYVVNDLLWSASMRILQAPLPLGDRGTSHTGESIVILCACGICNI